MLANARKEVTIFWFASPLEIAECTRLPVHRVLCTVSVIFFRLDFSRFKLSMIFWSLHDVMSLAQIERRLFCNRPIRRSFDQCDLCSVRMTRSFSEKTEHQNVLDFDLNWFQLIELYLICWIIHTSWNPRFHSNGEEGGTYYIYFPGFMWDWACFSFSI